MRTNYDLISLSPYRCDVDMILTSHKLFWFFWFWCYCAMKLSVTTRIRGYGMRKTRLDPVLSQMMERVRRAGQINMCKVNRESLLVQKDIVQIFNGSNNREHIYILNASVFWKLCVSFESNAFICIRESHTPVYHSHVSSHTYIGEQWHRADLPLKWATTVHPLVIDTENHK